MRYIPNDDPAKVDGLRAHLFAGTLVLTLMIIRIALRLRTRRPPRATARNPHLDRLARISHRLLYMLVIDVVLLGHGNLPADFWVFPVRSFGRRRRAALVGLVAQMDPIEKA